MFDLPVVTSADRKEYSRFRNYLLDSGFEMSQFSVYMRLLSSKERVLRYENRIASQLPENGKIQIITITDKQYENIKSFYGCASETLEKKDQFQLF